MYYIEIFVEGEGKVTIKRPVTFEEASRIIDIFKEKYTVINEDCENVLAHKKGGPEWISIKCTIKTENMTLKVKHWKYEYCPDALKDTCHIDNEELPKLDKVERMPVDFPSGVVHMPSIDIDPDITSSRVPSIWHRIKLRLFEYGGGVK